MAKKTFKGGLDSLLSSAEVDEIVQNHEPELKPQIEIELSDEQKHWLYLKIERLQKELKLWRTGELTPQRFTDSLKQHGYTYNIQTNEIE